MSHEKAKSNSAGSNILLSGKTIIIWLLKLPQNYIWRLVCSSKANWHTERIWKTNSLVTLRFSILQREQCATLSYSNRLQNCKTTSDKISLYMLQSVLGAWFVRHVPEPNQLLYRHTTFLFIHNRNLSVAEHGTISWQNDWS